MLPPRQSRLIGRNRTGGTLRRAFPALETLPSVYSPEPVVLQHPFEEPADQLGLQPRRKASLHITNPFPCQQLLTYLPATTLRRRQFRRRFRLVIEPKARQSEESIRHYHSKCRVKLHPECRFQIAVDVPRVVSAGEHRPSISARSAPPRRFRGKLTAQRLRETPSVNRQHITVTIRKITNPIGDLPAHARTRENRVHFLRRTTSRLPGVPASTAPGATPPTYPRTRSGARRTSRSCG